MKALRILVADDHEIVRRGLVELLKSHAGWEVCGEARDGREAVESGSLESRCQHESFAGRRWRINTPRRTGTPKEAKPR